MGKLSGRHWNPKLFMLLLHALAWTSLLAPTGCTESERTYASYGMASGEMQDQRVAQRLATASDKLVAIADDAGLNNRVTQDGNHVSVTIWDDSYHFAAEIEFSPLRSSNKTVIVASYNIRAAREQVREKDAHGLAKHIIRTLEWALQEPQD